MKGKWKALVCTVALLCAMGMMASCGDKKNNNPAELSSSNEVSSNEVGSSDETSSSDEESSSDETSSSDEESSSDETSSSDEESSSDETSSSDEESSSDETSSSDEESSSGETSSSDEESSSDEVSSEENSSSEEVSSDEVSSSEETSSADEVSSSEEESSSEENSSSETPVPVTYTIKFVDEDGNEISSATYEEGATVVEPDAPTKAADETYTYTFAGWDKEVTAATGDVTYTATYTPTYIDYTVKFVDEDGEISSATYHYGDTVTAPTPTKDADETYTYTFTGWDKEVTAVTGDVTYTATYESVYIDYIVKFVDEDGREISTETYHYGDIATEVEQPTKAETQLYTFSFTGWDKEFASTVTENVTYKATYTATLKGGYTVNNTTAAAGESVVLGASSIGNGAHYTGSNNLKDPQVIGDVNQSYLAFDGEYGFNDYIAFDFTGKNMPYVAFFADNYNNSMYYENGDKKGTVVITGLTDYKGELYLEEIAARSDAWAGKGLILSGPNMLHNMSKVQMNGALDFNSGAEANSDNKDTALGRANLEDGVQYRVVMGMQKSTSGKALIITYSLFDLTNNELVETFSAETWGYFTDSALGESFDSYASGSIVLYGHFGTTTTIDKVHGVFEDTTLEAVANGLNSDETYTVTFLSEDGSNLKTVENVAFGTTVLYDGEMPTPAKTEDVFSTYSYGWDKKLGKICGDTVYTLKLISTPKSNIKTSNATINDTQVVLGAGSIGVGADYVIGQNRGGSITQAYLGIDGEYGLGDYIALDFTGKNMPEIMFFAENYNTTMYGEGTAKRGMVVASGITLYNGSIGTAHTNNTQVGVSGPYGAYFASAAEGTGGSMMSNFNSALARANLVDGTHYRVIIGFAQATDSRAITLNIYLYNLDTNEVVENSSTTSWNFFTGSNTAVGGMTTADLVGSIVLYGKFGTTCTIDKLYGVFEDTDVATIAATLNGEAL